jgi:hypothetical protein
MIAKVRDLNISLKHGIQAFKAGGTLNYLQEWEKLTLDPEILESVSGLRVEFSDINTINQLGPHSLSKDQIEFANQEVSKLLKKGVIEKCGQEPGEFISPIFLREKKDGSHRLILNLKTLNTTTEKIHFKMETIYSILKLVRQNCWFTKIDLKDAYYTIPIDVNHRKLLKFSHNGKLFKFCALPNGYCHGPRKFTKLLKVPLSELRKRGVIISAFLDDCINIHRDPVVCLDNTVSTISMYQKLGFTVHPEPKSSFLPSQEMEFLGFILNSRSMTITLTPEKKTKMKNLCSEILNRKCIKIRQIASLLGKISSSFPASKFGRLHYRGLERLKTRSLAFCNNNFNANTVLDNDAIKDITWWRDNVSFVYNDICIPNPSRTLCTDASKTGWGAIWNVLSTGGLFSEEESIDHINNLELKAVLFGLQSYSHKAHDNHILVLCDNTTAVHCINKFGTCRSRVLDLTTQEIWACAIQNNIWLSATHIPGKLNVEADEESRKMEIHTEWKLNEKFFQEICYFLNFTPDIDLFASRLNTQLPKFISYRPDPQCFAVNAFLFSWEKFDFYCFPPFAVIARILQKIVQDTARGILVVPEWPTQPWYALLPEITIKSTILPPRKNLLFLPSHPDLHHPLHKNLSLRACLVDGGLLH